MAGTELHVVCAVCVQLSHQALVDCAVPAAFRTCFARHDWVCGAGGIMHSSCAAGVCPLSACSPLLKSVVTLPVGPVLSHSQGVSFLLRPWSHHGLSKKEAPLGG